MKINVLGTEYTVEERNVETDEKLAGADGYSDHTSKECIVDEMKKSNERTLKNIELYKKSVTRHEIIHAFLHESGLDVCSWAHNEEMVDWLAIQFPKLYEAFLQADCI